MKKQYFVIPLVVFSLLTSSVAFAQTSSTSTQTSTAPQQMVVTQAVNVRSSAEMGNNIIGQFHGGDVVTVTGQSNDNLWYKVNFNGQDGWVFLRFLKNQQTTPQQMTVTRDVNVRSSAEMGDNILGQYRKGDVINVIDQSADGYWYKVNFQNQDGWVSAVYVTRFAQDEMHGAATTPPATALHRIVGKNLNVRSYPGMGNNIIGSYKEGDTVDVLQKSTSGFWGKVNYNNQTGWIACKFLHT